MQDVQEPADASGCIWRVIDSNGKVVAAVCPDGIVIRGKDGATLWKVQVDALGVLTTSKWEG